MPPLDSDAFLKHLRSTFRVEADEHLRTMAALVRELEQPVAPARVPPLVERMFREAHSLKGAARSVNLSEIEALCAALETALARLKSGETSVSPPLVAGLVRDLDELERLLEEEGCELAPPRRPQGKPVADSAAPAPPAERLTEPGETVRISTARLSALQVQAEALTAFNAGAGHIAGELREIGAALDAWKKDWSRAAAEVRASRHARRRRGAAPERDRDAAGEGERMSLDRRLDAIERDELFVKTLRDRLARLQRIAEQEQRELGGIAEKLQDDMKQALMQPFGTLLELLPKLVRDLARDGGKDIELQIDGAAIEIDRRILEPMKDPLIHLVRNAVDHGIEAPSERVRRGKPERGRIRIAVTPKEGNRVELLVADDGAGIDLDKVAAAALRLGLVAPADADGLTRDDKLALVFESGLSTSAILTDISGRGLGLAIVREKIERLGGSVAIELPEAGGTQFRIVLPTALANFRGLLVAVGEDQFVLPARNVERVARIAPAAIGTVENREAIELDGAALALARLADVLGLPPRAAAAERLPIVVVASGGKRIAFAVDAVLGDQEVLVKGLGPQLRRVRNIAGATLLGAGRLVPILSVPDLMKSALDVGQRAPPTAPAPAATRRSLLVVEDSITSRSLLKNILESAGYDVATAVDGIDGLTALRTARFDLVVSDVEMPRMDGFDLTARIRQDPKLADLPVVLVTALGTREHRERGVEAGANAYIVKSGFDQSNLLEVIGRLT